MARTGAADRRPQIAESHPEAPGLSEHFDFSAPDRINDQEFNEVLWLMLKGDQAPPPAVQRPVVHLLQLTQ
jgi:hypothetical protein